MPQMNTTHWAARPEGFPQNHLNCGECFITASGEWGKISPRTTVWGLIFFYWIKQSFIFKHFVVNFMYSILRSLAFAGYRGDNKYFPSLSHSVAVSTYLLILDLDTCIFSKVHNIHADPYNKRHYPENPKCSSSS